MPSTNPVNNTQGGCHAKISDKTGVPILLLHGIPSSLTEWEPYIEDLELAGYKPYAVDLPGHGNSIKPVSIESYSEDAIYEQLTLWVDSLALDRPFMLVGHSFGGHLAIRYAFENPGRVDRLILINPFFSFGQITLLNRLLFYFPAIASSLYKGVPSFLINLFVWLGSLQEGKFLQSSLTDAEFASMTRDYQRCSPDVVYIPRSVNDLDINYSEIKNPVLMIFGGKDSTLKVSRFCQVASKMPSCKVVTIKAGHYPHRTNFQEVKRAIFDFLNS